MIHSYKENDIAYLPLVTNKNFYLLQGVVASTEASFVGDRMIQKVRLRFEGQAAMLNGKMIVEIDVEDKNAMLRPGIDECLEVLLLAREQLEVLDEPIQLIALCGKSIKLK